MSSAATITNSNDNRVTEMSITSLGVGDAQEGSRPKIHPKLYKAAVEGDVNILKDFLQSLDSQQLDGLSTLQRRTVGNNTLLHIAATSSSPNLKRSPYLKGRHPDSNYVEFAKEVFLRKRSLLMARNNLRETPLHCAAKAGNYTMVSLFISFVEDEHRVGKETFLTARNMHSETALHEAVRVGHRDMVNKLILSEPSLTGIVDAEGVSPLYLATMTNAFEIVRVFTGQEPSLVSCEGPKGQTALHAAVLEDDGITRALLEWKKSLATTIDDFESTPLRYAASVGNLAAVKLLLRHDTSAAYMADKKGLYPIHIAAKCGRREALVINELIEQIPDSDELLDKEGRNFLHIAIMSGKGKTIRHIRRNPTFLRMLNARDYQGNTPLHLAAQGEMYGIVRFLISMRMVYSSIMNRHGLTPVDLSLKLVDRGFRYTLNRQFNVLHCLVWTGALPSPRQVDRLADDLNFPAYDKEKEVEKAKSVTRSLGIVSVLIATVTFAAIFTMPGGYIADDHVNRGTPILSRKYAFKAFIAADLLAFVLSICATSWLIYAGSTIVDLELRLVCISLSAEMVKVAVKSTVCAFALAIYTMLSHINLPISIVVCVATIGLLPFSDPSYWGFLILALPLVKRLGRTGLFKSHFRPATWRRVPAIGVSYKCVALFGIIEDLLMYGIIFLLALI